MRKDGGPAFPASASQPGLTKRDYFAGQVVGSILADAAAIPVSHVSPTLDDVARKSYQLADAMLKAREAK